MDQFQTIFRLSSSDDSSQISTAISQQFMIEKIDLGPNFLYIPNSVFASLPLIKEHPENIEYSNGKRANREIFQEMLFLSHFLPDSTIEFQYPSGELKEAVFPAGTSLYIILSNLLPELLSSYSFLFFVRTHKETGKRLLLRPSSLPIGIFDVKDCIWSVEFIYIPEYIKYNKIYIDMLDKWFNDRKSQYDNKKEKQIKEFDDFLQQLHQTSRQEQLVTLLNKINQNSKAKVRRYETSSFTIKIEWGKEYGKDDEHQIVKIKSNQKTLIGLDLSSARIRQDQNQYIFTIKMLKDPKIVKTYKLTEEDALNLTEFFNLAVIPKNAEKNPENALSILFPDPQQKEFNVPQITSRSKINKLKFKNSKRLVREQKRISKKHQKFGWKDNEEDEDDKEYQD